MGEPPILLPLPGFEPLAESVTGVERVCPTLARFDNGEIEVRLRAPVAGRDCVVLGTAAPPAERLVELLLAADTLARHDARSVRAMLPYMAYARQDRPEPGHSLAAAWLGRALAASGIEAVTTIDIHSDAARELIGLPLASLSPAPLFARALAPTVSPDTVVVAPDGGAVARAAATAHALGTDRPVAWLEKKRTAAGVTHERIVGELARHAIVVDDILDTGGTLVSCCRELISCGVQSVTVAVTLGLFTGRRGSGPGAARRSSGLARVHTIASLLTAAVPTAGSGV